MKLWSYSAIAALAVTSAVLSASEPGAAGASAAHRHTALANPAVDPAPYALVPDGTGTASRISNFENDPFQESISAGDDLFGAAIASGETSALLATGEGLDVLTSINAVQAKRHTMTFEAYNGEGGKTLQAEPTGVGITGKTAVVAVFEQGILQLRNHDGDWKVDKRVKPAGASADHTRTEPGFIPFPRGHADHPLSFSGVAVSQLPSANEGRLALAVDRNDHRLVVIGKIGTAHPKVLARMSSPDLVSLGPGNEVFGDGSVAFSPVTAARAVVATPTGAAVLDLSKPTRPRLFPPDGTPLPKTAQPTDVAVAPDGEHVTVTAGNGLSSQTGLLTKHKLKGTGAMGFVGDGEVQGVSYLANGDFAIYRFDTVNNVTTSDFEAYSPDFDLIKQVPLSGIGLNDALAVAPGPHVVHFTSDPDVRIRAGHKVSAPLTLADPVGTYRYSVHSGRLPTGLSLKHHHLRGRTSDTGTHHVTIRALNEFGGAAFIKLRIMVH